MYKEITSLFQYIPFHNCSHFHFLFFLLKGNTVSAVPLNDETQRVIQQAVTSPRKSETDSLLTNQFSSAETRPSELTVVSPSMISRTMSSDISATMSQRNIEEELRTTQQGQQITTDSVAVITIDESIEEGRALQDLKDNTADDHVPKKMKYMEH